MNKPYNIIDNRKNNIENDIPLYILEELYKTDKSFMSEEEIKEYDEELLYFKNELDQIKLEEMDNFKTVKEVISYWPSLLQPKPWFIYES